MFGGGGLGLVSTKAKQSSDKFQPIGCFHIEKGANFGEPEPREIPYFHRLGQDYRCTPPPRSKQPGTKERNGLSDCIVILPSEFRELK